MIYDYTPHRQPKFNFDICRNKHKGNPESEAANKRVNKNILRIDVFMHITANEPTTSKEIATALNRPLHAISGRISELLQMNLIERTGERRDGCGLLEVKK